MYVHTCRCSKSQLELLLSTLEPVFHRDFVATLYQRYPSAGIRHMYERREAKRLADMSTDSSPDFVASEPQASSLSFSGCETELAPLSARSIDPDDALFCEQLMEEVLEKAFREIDAPEPVQRPESMTPRERRDIAALTPSFVFGAFTPLPAFSPDPDGRRGPACGMYRPSVEQLMHRHNTARLSRLNTADFHHREARSERKSK